MHPSHQSMRRGLTGMDANRMVRAILEPVAPDGEGS